MNEWREMPDWADMTHEEKGEAMEYAVAHGRAAGHLRFFRRQRTTHRNNIEAMGAFKGGN